MKRFTQTDTEHGNCWQTAVACILEVDPASLPCQVTIERAKKSYWNAINSYLIEHHGLFYSELFHYVFSALEIRRDWLGGYHMLIGPTVRTPQNGRNHVVVGHLGNRIFDVHPSRAGLTSVERWGVLGKASESQIESRIVARQREEPDLTLFCLCPQCIRPEHRDILQGKTGG